LAQTVRGRVLLFAVAVLAVSTYNSWWEAAFVVGAAMAFAYLEKQRNLILFAATYAMAFSAFWLSETAIEENIAVVAAQEGVGHVSTLLLAHLALITFMIFSWSALMVVRKHKSFILARRPVIALLAIYVALCGLTVAGPAAWPAAAGAVVFPERVHTVYLVPGLCHRRPARARP
jgi:hypothetical protein